MVILSYLIAFATLPINFPVLFVAETAGFLWVSDKLHDYYHVEGHWLEKYPWFLERRERHFQHRELYFALF